MCAIFGYISNNNKASSTIIDGLKRMEYRGYDSWGVSLINQQSLEIIKKVGSVSDADQVNLEGTIGIGHTRWATHGSVNEINAHPHTSSDKRFSLVQNGIVENYQELKEMLTKKGYTFISETDTEVIVRLIESLLIDNDLELATKNAFLKLKGRNTIAVLDKNTNSIFAIRNGSPLIYAENPDTNEIFLASDVLSFAEKATHYQILDDMCGCMISKNESKFYNLKTKSNIKKKVTTLDKMNTNIDKDGFDHFMIKEIYEQPNIISNSMHNDPDIFRELSTKIRNSNRVYVTGAGTAYHAAMMISNYLRTYGDIDSMPIKAYDSGSFENIMTKDDLLIAVSQSGETADTIDFINRVKPKGLKIASIVNMIGSTIPRISDYSFYTKSGPEIAVTSTKAFTAQSFWGYYLSKYIIDEVDSIENEITILTNSINSFLSKESQDNLKLISRNLLDKEHFFVLGKGQNTPIAMEAALKVKEITYKHFEGFTAGELKHGVIALIEEGTPVFVIISEDEFESDMISATAEVKARGALVIGVSNKDNELFDCSIISKSADSLDSIAKIIPFQLLSYYMALELGYEPDKPRNLAKSVTVK